MIHAIRLVSVLLPPGTAKSRASGRSQSPPPRHGTPLWRDTRTSGPLPYHGGSFAVPFPRHRRR